MKNAIYNSFTAVMKQNQEYSDENIEISSSNFHLTAEGNVTASGIRLRGGEIINEHYWKYFLSKIGQL